MACPLKIDCMSHLSLSAILRVSLLINGMLFENRRYITSHLFLSAKLRVTLLINNAFFENSVYVTRQSLSAILRVTLLINVVFFENRLYVTPVFERHTESQSANQCYVLQKQEVRHACH